MQLTLSHRVKYTADSIPLEDVIESLQAQERLLYEGIAVLIRAAPDSDLRLINIKVGEIVTGSLTIDLILEVYHAYQAQIDGKIVRGIESLTGIDVPPEAETLVSLAALGVTYFVCRWAYEAVFQKKKKEDPLLPSAPPIHIEGDYNKVVTLIANQLNMSDETIDRAFRDEITPAKRRQLVGRVAAFMRPAKNNPGSEITVKGFGSIDPEAIAECPMDYELEDLGESVIQNLPGARIEIRALDRDSIKTGWKAKVLGNKAFPKKLPMDLYPTIDAERLADFRVIKGDLAVEYKHDQKGDLVPSRLHLLSFNPDSE